MKLFPTKCHERATSRKLCLGKHLDSRETKLTVTIEKLIKRKSDKVKENCLVSKWQTTIQKGDKRDLVPFENKLRTMFTIQIKSVEIWEPFY